MALRLIVLFLPTNMLAILLSYENALLEATFLSMHADFSQVANDLSIPFLPPLPSLDISSHFQNSSFHAECSPVTFRYALDDKCSSAFNFFFTA